MAAISATESLRSSTPSFPQRQATAPRSATPTRSLRHKTPSRSSTIHTPRSATPPAKHFTPSALATGSSPQKLSSDNADFLSSLFPISHNPLMGLDRASNSLRPQSPHRAVNPPRGMPQRRAAGKSSALHSADAAKRSLMRRLAADAPHLRPTLACQHILLGPAAHLFEDPQIAETSALKANGHGARLASLPPSQLPHTTPPSYTGSPTRSGSTSKSTVVKSSSLESMVSVEVKVGSASAPVFTEEKAKMLRQKMREAESYHDTMYHSGLASRLA